MFLSRRHQHAFCFRHIAGVGAGRRVGRWGGEGERWCGCREKGREMGWRGREVVWVQGEG